MAFLQFPNQQYFRILDTDTETRLGYFNLDHATELAHVMLTIYVNGTIPSAFDMTLNVYSSSRYSSPLYTSEAAEISVATLVPTYVTNWLGNIYLDFDRNPLNPNINYYLSVETNGYTRNGDIYYVGVNLDWYSPVNNQLSATEAGARMRILGYR